MKKTTTYQKPSSTTKDTNKEPLKVGWRIYIIKFHNPGWATPPPNCIPEAFQRSEKSEPHIRLPSPGIMHQEKTLRALGFEGQKGLLSGDPED